MNRTSQSRDCFSHRACRIFVAAVLLVLASFTLAPGAWAQGTPTNNAAGGNNDLATNDGGTIDDTNGGSAGKIRENYFKRYPFARDAFKHDKLQTVSAATARNTGGKSTGTNARDPVTGAQGNTSGTNTTTNTGAEGEKTNLKQSQLNTTPTKVLAYDMMVLPFYGVGHWLPGAEPWKQPQYASQADIPIYIQPIKMYGMDKPLTMRDNELFDNTLTTYGLPMSDTQYQLINRENNQRFLELLFDPERVLWLATNTSQMQGACAANSIGASAEAAYGTAANYIVNGPGAGAGGGGGGGAGGGGAAVGALINIANENSGYPTASDNPEKTIPQAVWMVQQMYRQVFVPLAILFLLPGAVISQVKMQITSGMGQSGAIKSDDTPNPFEGILRSVVAVFLIPATQLIVSYSIDTGNSMAYSVKDWVGLNQIMDWAHQLSYNPPPGNVDNAIVNPGANANGTAAGGGGTNPSGSSGFFSGLGSTLSFIPGAQSLGNTLQGIFNAITNPGAGGEGLGANTTEGNTIVERQLWLSQIMQVAFNMAMYLFSTAVITLGAYQLIMMCYLYLLGPLAAAFYAWPSIAGSGPGMFRGIFANWLNAVITVALWRFYWMVILAIMTQRILYLQDTGGGLDLQWEVAVFTCLLGLMLFVPFNPWVFDPAQAYTTATQGGAALMSGAAGGANGQQGGIMGAVGNAAIAGGANANAVHQLQQGVANTTNQMGTLGMNAQERQMQTLGLDGGLYTGTQSSNSGGNSGGNMSMQQPPPLLSANNSGGQSTNNNTQGGGGTNNAPPMYSEASNNAGNMSTANNTFANTAVQVQPQGGEGGLPVEQPNAMSAYVNPSASGDQVANSLQDQGFNAGSNGGTNSGGTNSGGTSGGDTTVADNTTNNSNTSTNNTNVDSGPSNDKSSGEGDTRLADAPPPPSAFPGQGDDGGSFA